MSTPFVITVIWMAYLSKARPDGLLFKYNGLSFECWYSNVRHPYCTFQVFSPPFTWSLLCFRPYDSCSAPWILTLYCFHLHEYLWGGRGAGGIRFMHTTPENFLGEIPGCLARYHTFNCTYTDMVTLLPFLTSSVYLPLVGIPYIFLGIQVFFLLTLIFIYVIIVLDWLNSYTKCITVSWLSVITVI